MSSTSPRRVPTRPPPSTPRHPSLANTRRHYFLSSSVDLSFFAEFPWKISFGPFYFPVRLASTMHIILSYNWSRASPRCLEVERTATELANTSVVLMLPRHLANTWVVLTLPRHPLSLIRCNAATRTARPSTRWCASYSATTAAGAYTRSVRAQLEQLQDTFMSKFGLHGGQKCSS